MKYSVLSLMFMWLCINTSEFIGDWGIHLTKKDKFNLIQYHKLQSLSELNISLISAATDSIFIIFIIILIIHIIIIILSSSNIKCFSGRVRMGSENYVTILT